MPGAAQNKKKPQRATKTLRKGKDRGKRVLTGKRLRKRKREDEETAALQVKRFDIHLSRVPRGRGV